MFNLGLSHIYRQLPAWILQGKLLPLREKGGALGVQLAGCGGRGIQDTPFHQQYHTCPQQVVY
jgi:hypothetical protein